jgi:hypothetical protein
MATPVVTPDAGQAQPEAQPVQSTADKALELFRQPDAQPNPAEPAKVDPQNPALPAEAQPVEVDPLEAVKDNPRVVELLAMEEQHKAFTEALQDLPYAVTNPQEMKSQLTDAAMLYDIVSGKRKPSELLEIMEANNHWTAEQKTQLYSDLAQYISAKTGQPVAAKAQGQEFTDPVQKELAEIKGKLTAQEQKEQQAVQEAEQKRVNTAFEGKVAEFCKDFPDDAKFYGERVAQKIAGNPSIIAAVAKGNFAQVNKLLLEERNADVQRFERWSRGLLAKKESDKNAIPRSPNGQFTPSAPAKMTFKNAEEAEAHRLKMFRGEA